MSPSTPGVLAVRDGILNGTFSAEEVVSRAIRSIQRADAHLGAMTEIFAEEAVERARAVDGARARGEEIGWLGGVPFTAKDNMCTLWGHTTAASRIIRNFRAPYVATAVRRLEEAGAICVGKTNMDEFAMGSSTETSAYRVTRNPWDPSRVPGGSSGGAAAMCAVTHGVIHIGSDTGGSIRQPASFCGVTGLKPTYGRVSRYGLLAYASSLDQIGPFGRDARECALGLKAIAGPDPMDSTAAAVPVPDYLEEIEKGVAGMRIGVPKEYFAAGIDPEVEEKVRAGIGILEGLGVAVEEVSLPHAAHANPCYYVIAMAEASSNLARYDGVHYGHRTRGARDLVDLYSRSRSEGFGEEVKRRVLLGTFVLSSGYYDAYYLKALKVRTLVRRDYEDAFRRVDAIACPTLPVVPFRIGERIDDPLKLYAVDILTVSANLASVPAVSFPCGFSREGLPIGLQILGRPFEDAQVLRLAHAYQCRTDFHREVPPLGAAEGDA